MLTHRLASLSLATIVVGLIVVLTPAMASADCTYVMNPATGQLKLVCEEDGGGDPGGGDDDGNGGGTSACAHNGQAIPCQRGGVGTWNGECYVTPTQVEVQLPAPAGQTQNTGAWYYCVYQSAGGTPGTIWVRNGTTFIDPVVLAYRAVAAMDLDTISIGIVPESGPDRVGLVGLPVWMWVDNQTEDTWGPITRSASEGPVSVAATASVSSVIWDMGDGAKVTCTGPGTPYADHYGKQESPTCGHRYAKMSSGQADGAYQVTATSHWVVEWNGGGQSGTIELDLTTEPLPIRVGEAQVLTQ